MKKIINTLLALSLAGCSSQAVVTPTVKPTNTAQPAVTQEVQPIEEVELPSLESTCTIWDTIENDLETEIEILGFNPEIERMHWYLDEPRPVSEVYQPIMTEHGVLLGDLPAENIEMALIPPSIDKSLVVSYDGQTLSYQTDNNKVYVEVPKLEDFGLHLLNIKSDNLEENILLTRSLLSEGYWGVQIFSVPELDIHMIQNEYGYYLEGETIDALVHRDDCIYPPLYPIWSYEPNNQDASPLLYDGAALSVNLDYYGEGIYTIIVLNRETDEVVFKQSMELDIECEGITKWDTISHSLQVRTRDDGSKYTYMRIDSDACLGDHVLYNEYVNFLGMNYVGTAGCYRVLDESFTKEHIECFLAGPGIGQPWLHFKLFKTKYIKAEEGIWYPYKTQLLSDTMQLPKMVD